jgi:hypothetical protein
LVRNRTDKVEPQTYHLLMVAAHRPACFEDIDGVLACLQSLVKQMIALQIEEAELEIVGFKRRVIQ